MGDELDSRLLESIDRALQTVGLCPSLPAELREYYAVDLDQARRRSNREVVALFTILFDLVWLPQFQSASGIVLLWAVMRLGIFTPCVILFLIMDRRDRLGKWYDVALAGLAVAPSLGIALLTVTAASPTLMSDAHAAPLILLGTGLMWRMTLPAAITNAIASSICFLVGIVLSGALAPMELGVFGSTDLGVAVSVVVFNLRIEARERQVFLLNLRERIRRAELMVVNDGLLRETQTDALTKVANRRCFDDTLMSWWHHCRVAGERISLVMIDVDNFKAFNDYYGHQGGDECLARVAATLRSQIRGADFVARYGGEEFVVVLPCTGLELAAVVAERMRLAVIAMGLPNEGVGSGAVVSISLGVAAALPTEHWGVRHLVETADRHLYNAKRGGRNRVNTGDAVELEAAHAIRPHGGLASEPSQASIAS